MTGDAGTGMIVGPGVLGGKTPEEVLASCTAPSPGRSPLRRLSNTEYRNTIRDLIGIRRAWLDAATELVAQLAAAGAGAGEEDA